MGWNILLQSDSNQKLCNAEVVCEG